MIVRNQNTQCIAFCCIWRCVAADCQIAKTNIGLFYSNSEVNVATQIQSISRPDGGSAPRDDLYSPECQRRPCQLDELQRQIPCKDLDGHRHKTTRTRGVLCTIWLVLQPGIKPCHAGFVRPEENCPLNWALVSPKVFFLNFCHYI